MFRTKTHFEQVSLEIVRKIVEEQNLRATTTEQEQGTKKNTLGEDLLRNVRVLKGEEVLRLY